MLKEIAPIPEIVEDGDFARNERVIKQPRPGTKIAGILSLLRSGESPDTAAEQFGVSRHYISVVESNARMLGYSSTLSEEQRTERRQEGGKLESIKKGGVSVTIEPFLRMGLLPVEIVIATSTPDGEFFSYEQVNNAVGHLRRTRTNLKPETAPAQQTEINKQSLEPKEKIKKRIQLFFATQTLLSGYGLAEIPLGRGDWLLLSELLHAQRENILGNYQPLAAFREKLRTLPEEVTTRLQPCINLLLDPDQNMQYGMLIQMAKSGDKKAFTQLYNNDTDFVYRYFLKRLGNKDLAEDLKSLTFFKALQGMGNYCLLGRYYENSFKKWTLTIAKNVLTDYFRHQRQNLSLEDTHQDTNIKDLLVDMQEREQAMDLQAAIRKLTPAQREVIYLRFYKDYSPEEIATILGKARGTVSALQFQALKKLRNLVTEA